MCDIGIAPHIVEEILNHRSGHRSGGAMVPANIRMRYTSRSVLKRLDEMPGGTTWADGTKRFSAVK